MTPEVQPPAPQPLCAHCRKPLTSIGWLHNQQAGLVTFYHNEPDCMVVVNCQMIPIEQPRVQMAEELTRFQGPPRFPRGN